MQESDREEVRAIVRDELARHGLRAKETDENRDLLRWCRNHKAAFESAGNWTFRSFVLALVGGLIVAVWEGLKLLIGRGSP